MQLDPAVSALADPNLTQCAVELGNKVSKTVKVHRLNFYISRKEKGQRKMCNCDECIKENCRWHIANLCSGSYEEGDRCPCILTPQEQETAELLLWEEGGLFGATRYLRQRIAA